MVADALMQATTEGCELTNNIEYSKTRTIQLHPTLRCNLACKHCYSSSSPALKGGLDLDALKKFFDYAWQQGYNAISVSGGEPLLYRQLDELFTFTKDIGYRNFMATNAMLLKTDFAHRVLDNTDLVAVSIDGKPNLHNDIRAQPFAFDKMLEGVEILKNRNKGFGFIHTITNKSWQDLIWLADFVFEKGAGLLQLHPLELAGRAVSDMQDYALDELTLHKIFVITHFLREKYEPLMPIQLDMLHRDYIRDVPSVANISTCGHLGNRLSDYIDTLIVDEKGDVVPMVYGLSKAFTITNVNSFPSNAFEQYFEKRKDDLASLFKTVYNNILNNPNDDLVNWSERLLEQSFKLN
jgi:Fe-coproporphyrin III synthase